MGTMTAVSYPALQRIPLEAIAIESPDALQFVFTRFPVVTELVDSIRQVGLLHPLLLLAQHDGGPYQIICGYRRLLACQLLGYSPLPAFCYPAHSLSPAQALWMSLQEDLPCRQYTPLEQGIVLQKFQQLLGYTSKKLATDLAPLLALPPTVSVAERYLQFPDLEISLQRALHEGRLSPEQIGVLLPLPPEERHLFFHQVLEPCAPNLNETREILGYLLELKASLRCSLQTLLARPELVAIREDALLSRRKRCQLLCYHLRLLRYPLLTQQEILFRKSVQALALPPNIDITHPPFFEGNTLTLTLRPKHLQEFQAMLSSLEQAGQREDFRTLFAILQGETIAGVGQH